MRDESSSLRTSSKRSITWVLKISKYCNLRCAYCYEYPNLSDKRRFSSEDLENLFDRIAKYHSLVKKSARIVWHGGEPLLQKTGYLKSILKIQNRVLQDHGVKYKTAIQTNLTILDAERINLIKEHNIDVGVSFDFAPNCRVDAAGRDSNHRVLMNMDLLRGEGIKFACIAVLSKKNQLYIDEMIQFFDEANINLRVLPIYRDSAESNADPFSLTHSEILSAMKKIFDAWLISNNAINIKPIADCIRVVLRHRGEVSGFRPVYYQKSRCEYVYIVDVNGDLYSVADAYDEKYRHGNILRSSVSDLRTTEGCLRSIVEAQSRISSACGACRYYGSCSGWAVGESTPMEREVDEFGNSLCTLHKPLCEHIEYRLNSLRGS